jgi:Outer membrane protein beta-barrel domain
MMRLHKILSSLVLLALFAGTARAEKVAFMVDGAAGISAPIGDNDYKNFADPSFKLSLRVGAVFYVHPKFGVAPEAQFDWIPVNSNDSTFQSRGIDAQVHRIRALGGGRFIVPFGIGSFYARVAMGVDYITGTFSVDVPIIGRQSTTGTSTAFTVEPGVGVQFNLARHLVAGLYTGFPIAPNHSIVVNAAGGTVSGRKFTAVDIDFLAVFGVRI